MKIAFQIRNTLSDRDNPNTAERVAYFRNGGLSVTYSGKVYRLLGGIRAPYFIYLAQH